MAGQAVAVVGAAGGVGASTLAALLAARLASGGRAVTLVDLDARHGGIEVLLGTETREGARWADLDGVRGPVGPAELHGLLPRWGPVEVLGGDRRSAPLDASALTAVWDGLLASGRTVVADVPAHALAQPAVEDLARAARSILVTGQDVVGVASAATVAPLLGASAGLVLRRRPGSRVAPAQAGAVLHLALLGLLPTDRRVAGAVDRGLGPTVAGWSPLSRAVRRVAARLGEGGAGGV